MAAIQRLAKSLQLGQTLRDPIDGSPPGSVIPGIFQARVLEWVAIAFFTSRTQNLLENQILENLGRPDGLLLILFVQLI